ncbi:MAG TPA: flagellar motor protein MotB [Opitutaceae bacterium]|nr:flagellar motor protein MotB [Opitutaceae bacterium]
MAKKKAAAHHGGAWKVAYADFVTAMMALFMVLWISAQDKKILIATSRYFQSPFRSPMEDHSGVMPFNKDNTSESKSDDTSTPKPAAENKAIDISFLNSVAADFYRLLHIDQDLQKKPIDIEVTSDGLRVTLFDRGKQPLFAENGADFTPWGKFVMQNLAWLIDRHGFHVMIDGHTRSQLKLPRPDYGAWELSADRANAARRSLVYYAVDPQMIERVSGYADTKPLSGEPATSESNQRITLSLSLAPKRPPVAKAAPSSPAPAGPATAAAAPAAAANRPL